MRWSSLALLASLLVTVIGSSSGRSSSSVVKTKYNALFGFGDSITDTGNICISSNSTELEVLTLTHPPYGMTYFGKPSCRWSNGRVIIDFIAQALGFPLLLPSKSKGKDFRHGANMAITGGTALNFSFYEKMGIEDPIWNHGPLSTQVQWFEDLMPSICGTKQNCQGFLEKSLFVFGGFGGNDYNIQLLELLLTVDQAMKNTPLIIQAIANGVERLIALGAVHIVVPGILPTGCLPLFTSLFANSSTEADFDQYGCLKTYSRLTEYHNSLLQQQVKTLQRNHRSARIMYADYSLEYYQMVKEPKKFGFNNPFETCCGAGGGKYNFDVLHRCGMQGVTTACRDPSARLSWDGVHPTEAANKIIADSWLNGPYCSPPIDS